MTKKEFLYKKGFDKLILTCVFSLQKKLDDNKIDEIVEKQLMLHKMYDLCNYIIDVNQSRSETANNFIEITIRVKYEGNKQQIKKQ